MPGIKSRTAKPLSAQGPFGPRRTEAAGAVQKFAREGTDFANDVTGRTKAMAKETSKAFKQTYSIVSKGAAELNVQWIEMIRVNINSNLDFTRQLIGVKSPSELLDLCSEHSRKRCTTLVEQTQQLFDLAQKKRPLTWRSLFRPALKTF